MNLINGFYVSTSIILNGINNLYYKEHYLYMAQKYNMPGYGGLLKYAKWFIVGGSLLLVLWILLLFLL